MSDLKQQLREEIALFCQQHPDVEEVDLISAGMTPNLWGKRYPIGKLTKLIDELKMPRGNYLMSPVGEYIPVLHYNDTDGDPDAAFQFVPGTLKPVPWQPHRAQIMFSSADASEPFVGEPRVVLSNVLDKLAAKDMLPTVAFELEFYLIDKNRTEDGLIQVPKNPINGRDDICAVLSMDRLDMFAELLTDIRQSCEEQGINSTAISAEIGAGQFEINLNHRSDCLKAADEVIQYQRLIKGVAVKHGYEATFMAKPYLQDAGNGMHLHISMYDSDGNNQFAKNNQQALMHAVAGCLDTMHGAFAFIASNPNAYRRYVPDLAIATQKSWAHENRYVAVRIPASDDKNLRIEHRVPAADSNPYLVLAAILAGIDWGMENKLEPGEPYEGLACYEHLYPHTLEQALQKLDQSEALRNIMGSHFVDIYLAYKRSEVKEFYNMIAAREYAWYV